MKEGTVRESVKFKLTHATLLYVFVVRVITHHVIRLIHNYKSHIRKQQNYMRQLELDR